VPLRDILELPDRLEPHFGVADVRDEAPHIAQTMVLLPEQTAPHFFADEAESGARFL
jgi:hypothetical protein